MNMGYVDTKELQQIWTEWNKKNSPRAWEQLSDGVYKICYGVATQFHPQSDDEHSELAHHAFAQTMDKIRDGRLAFIPGKAPVFNLLTTAIFNCLYSLKTSEKRRNNKIVKYGQQALENLPAHMRPILSGRASLVKYPSHSKF